jgi:hypothetical protein
MKQRDLTQDTQLEALLDEYRRLNRIADEALSSNNLRSRPNWFRFYEAHEEITSVVEKMKLLNGHS